MKNFKRIAWYLYVELFTVCMFTSCGSFEPKHAKSTVVLNKIYDYAKCYYVNIEDYQKKDKVEMLDWLYNEDGFGDTYTGYFVKYRVDTGCGIKYVLVSLVEFDNSDKYELTVIASEDNLTSLMLYLE